MYVLDLHLALFSAHSSFRLDLRSFWLFMLTWTRKRAFVSWRTGIYVFFPGIYAHFPAKYAYNFGFKIHKVQKCLKWCNYAHVEKNRSKSRNLSNEHLFVFFRGCMYICIYVYTYIRIYVYTYMCIICITMYIRMYVCIYIYICGYRYIGIYADIYICIYGYMYIIIYVYMYIVQIDALQGCIYIQIMSIAEL